MSKEDNEMLKRQQERLSGLLKSAGYEEEEVVTWKKRKTVKKKKVTVKHFFPTLKNSQGFDMHLCRYEDSIGDHVYVPKKYGQLRAGWMNNSFCPNCKLQPCINVEYYEDIQHQSFQVYYAQEEAEAAGKKTKPLAALQKMEKYTLKFMTKHFGRNYMKRVGTPGCIITETHKYHRGWHTGDFR